MIVAQFEGAGCEWKSESARKGEHHVWFDGRCWVDVPLGVIIGEEDDYICET